MTLLGFLIFSSAFGVSTYVIAATVVPNMARIADALAGRQRGVFEPLEQLVRAERRIAVRRWASATRAEAVRAAA